jgi:hypothetical protein
MSFNTNNLGQYISIGKEYALAAVRKSKFAEELMKAGHVQFGKGKVAVLRIDADTNIHESSDCGARSTLSTINLSNKELDIKPLADYANLCPKKLWNTFYSTSLLKGQTPSEDFIPEFVDSIMMKRAEKLAFENEKLMFQDTGSTLNGIIEQLSDAGVTTSAVSGSDMVAKLQNVFTGSTVDARSKEDFHIFMSPEVFAEYQIALSNRNLFAGNDLTMVYGTTAKIFVASGLSGKREVIAARLSAFQLGVDAESDLVNASLDWSNETKQYYQDFQYGLGIVVVWPEEVSIKTV